MKMNEFILCKACIYELEKGNHYILYEKLKNNYKKHLCDLCGSRTRGNRDFYVWTPESISEMLNNTN